MRFATRIGGTDRVSGLAIAVNTKGEAFVAGAVPRRSAVSDNSFLWKLDATGAREMFSTNEFGGSLVTVDAQGNVYVAGVEYEYLRPPIPVTSGAFQASHTLLGCGGTTYVIAYCVYQYVIKLSASGNKLYATYVTGSYGAIPLAITADLEGNVYLAGATNSPDYPVTPGSFQTEYTASGRIPMPNGSVHAPIIPPVATGYVTKLNANGTDLVWSTFFGGSGTEAITSLTRDGRGFVYVAGTAGSSDLPGLRDVPSGCRPSLRQPLSFVTRLSAAGDSVAPAQLFYGGISCGYCSVYSPAAGVQIGVRPGGAVVVAQNNAVLKDVDLFASSPLACFVDPADQMQTKQVAPGQLLSINGLDLAERETAADPGTAQDSLGGVTVTFNGVPAPILYASPDRVTVQAPYELAGQDNAEMRITSERAATVFSHTARLGITPRQPSIFASPGASTICGERIVSGTIVSALNEDGTTNSCENPAPNGSMVTVYLNGLGVTNPLLATGGINPASPVPLDLPLTIETFAPLREAPSVVSASTAAGSISAVWQAKIRLPKQSPGYAGFLLSVDGVPVRAFAIVWTK